MQGNDEIDLSLIDIDSIDLSGWNFDENNKNKDLASMLSMLDAPHCIVVTDDIGLVGYGYDEEPLMKIITDGKTENKIAILANNNVIYGFRGNYFKVINKYGVLLFDEYIDTIFTVYNKENNIIAHIFKLKDYTKFNINIIFDDGSAYVLYDVYTEKLYVNALDSYAVAQKIGEITDTKFNIDVVGPNGYLLTLDNVKYRSFRVVNNYNIYNFYENIK